MKIMWRLAVSLLVLPLAGCASLQVDRDLKHAELVQQYRSAVGPDASLTAAPQCTAAAIGATWTTLQFAPTTPVTKLPSGQTAASFCVQIPVGARALELQAFGKGGMTFHEMIVVHPSLQFLDEKQSLIKNVAEPQLSAFDNLGGFGLRGVTVLTTDLSAARSVIVYVHPDSLEGSLDVHTGYETIPVPYGPYGQVKVRFK